MCVCVCFFGRANYDMIGKSQTRLVSVFRFFFSPILFHFVFSFCCSSVFFIYIYRHTEYPTQ